MDQTRLFKFRSFSDRISSIKIDVIHQLTTPNNESQPPDGKSFFQESLVKWRELNCSFRFIEFFSRVSPKANSLAQILYHKEEILEELLTELKEQDPLSLEPLLDLLVQLAKDLQDEFYSHFKTFFPVLVSLCNLKDPNVIEQSFNCLAYLFKFLQRHMLGDMKAVFKMYSESLLVSTKFHIKRFAVESFGFLLRKVSNLGQFFGFLLNTLVLRKPQIAEGVGMLLFEVCKGVMKQFHSCTEKVLSELFTVMHSQGYDSSEVVFTSLFKMIEMMAEHTRREYSNPVWTPLVVAFDTAVSHLREDYVSNEFSVVNFMKLIDRFDGWKNGSRMTTTALNKICLLLVKIAEDGSDGYVGRQLVTSVANLLVLHHADPVALQQFPELTQSIFNYPLSCSDNSMWFAFQLYNRNYPTFDEDILPVVIDFCKQILEYRVNVGSALCPLLFSHNEEDLSNEEHLPQIDNVLYFIAKLSHIRDSILEFPRSEGVPINVMAQLCSDTMVKSMTMREQWTEGDPVISWRRVWGSIKCLQYIRPISPFVTSLCCDFFSKYWEVLRQDEGSGILHEKELILSESLKTLASVLDRARLVNIVSIQTLLSITRCFPVSILVLESVLKCIEKHPTSVLENKHFETLLAVLKGNLSSSNSKLRLVTLKLLNHAPPPLLPVEQDSTSTLSHEKCDVISNCLRAEETPSTLEAYRTKLIWLSKLKYSQAKFDRLPNVCKEIPLRYLLGVLYVNLKVLWEPVCNFISSYAQPELKELFWNVFGKTLEKVKEDISNTSGQFTPSEVSSITGCSTLACLMKAIVAKGNNTEGSRPDPVTYRISLWKCMTQFTQLAESKSRTLIPQLMDFMSSEYGPSDDTMTSHSTQDISAEETMEEEENHDDDDEEGSIHNGDGHDSPVGNHADDAEQGNSQRLNRSELSRTLIAMLTLTSQFTNPRSLHRQEDLRALYMRLLMSRRSEIQLLALKGLLSYKDPYLTPYRENLEQLLDESAFHEQLLCLSLCSEVCVVDESHYESLVPIIVRILIGRRKCSTSKSKNSSRRNVIMRYLGANGEQVVSEYLHLLQSPLTKNHLLNSMQPDPSRVVPLKVQQSFLYEVSQLVKAVGDQLKSEVSSILSLVFKIANHCILLLDGYRQQVLPSQIGPLKEIRRQCINLTAEIMDNFPCVFFDNNVEDDDYDEDDDEDLEMSFACSILYPLIPRLPLECTESPTPLLKLLVVFSHHRELHYLLGNPTFVEAEEVYSNPVLHYVIECLDRASRPVVNIVIQMILSLTANSPEGDSIGCCTVKPFIPSLLIHIKKSISSAGSDINSKKAEFELLSRITLIQNEPTNSDQLIQLLLPFLVGPRVTKDAEKILRSIYNLIPSSTNLSNCYRSFSKLFLTLKFRSNRDLLNDIFTRLATKDESLTGVLPCLKKVNSYLVNLVDEPDYWGRQEGFSEAKQLLSLKTQTGHLQTSILLPILYNALYSIFEVDDVSIRDAAASFITHLVDTVTIRDQHAFDTLILSTLVPALIKGFTTKKELILNECVNILGHLARVYSSHPKFSDFCHLTNTNLEMDFFSNVRHIQLHRRTKAFRLLSQVCSKENLSSFTMTKFLLPLANHIILSPVKEREHNLLLEAVSAVGAITGKLKWSGYLYVLKHYLKLLTKETELHKNIVRVIVAVLDSFHFKVVIPRSDSPCIDLPPPSPSLPNTGGDEPMDDSPHPETEEGKEEEGENEREEQEEKSSNEEDEVMNQCVSDDAKQDMLAERIRAAVMDHIIPSLEAQLTASCEVQAHKLSKSDDVAVSEKVRVPIAMAILKLLLQLPDSLLQLKLPGILMKVCNTMKSRLNDVREAARDTLLKMAQSLGCKYIHYIFNEMTAILTRGYQLHVLSFSIHHLLQGLVPKLNSGDLDISLATLSSILMADIFGRPAEEREVKEIVSKTPEAKSCKSVLSFGLIARFLSPGLIPKLLKPVKEMFDSNPSSKVASLIEDVLKKVAIGLRRNRSFTTELMLLFIHETLTVTAKSMVRTTTRNESSEATPLHPVDSHLIPAAPTRANPPKISKQTNLAVHLITQFGLQLFKIALKKGKFKPSSEKDHLAMLDPFVYILCEDVLGVSRHAKLLSKALSCIMIMLPLPLPQIKNHLSDISSHLFSILRHFSYSGSVTSSQSQELVTMAFKCMTVILRDFTSSSISSDEGKLLVSYIEQDIHDYKRQSTAFPLLKVILSKRVAVDELSDLMYKVAELSVQGETPRVRVNSRTVLVQYLLNYPLGKKVNRYLDFLVANLNYEEQSGRESVIETLGLVFNKFPQNILNENVSYFLLPVASQLVNEDSSTCRQMLAEMVKILFKRVTKEKRMEIAVMIKDWLTPDKIVLNRLSVQLLGFLVDMEGKDFNKRLPIFLPLILKCLNLVKQDSNTYEGISDGIDNTLIQSTDNSTVIDQYPVALKDHFLFNSLTTVEKIFVNCGINCSNTKLSHSYDQIWDLIHHYLLYPHSWVRLVASRLFGQLFAASNIDEIIPHIINPSDTEQGGSTKGGKSKMWLRFFASGGLLKIRDLKQCFMSQLKAQLLSEELANQAIKNQVFIAKFLFKLHLMSPDTIDQEDDKQREGEGLDERPTKRRRLDGDTSEDEKDIKPEEEELGASEGVVSSPGKELRSLIYQMDRLTRYEAGNYPKESMKRSCVFKWIGAVAMAMGSEHISDWLYRLIPPLYKELSNTKKVGGEELHNLAHEVVDLVKSVTGRELFSAAYSKVMSTAQQKRVKRKAQYALEAVVDPERHILRKWRKSRKKRVSKRKAIASGSDSSASASKRLKLMRKLKKKRHPLH